MIIKVKVKPNSKNQEIEKKNDFYFVKLKSPPKDDKANLELLKLLKKYFKKEVEMKAGFSSKNKIIGVEG